MDGGRLTYIQETTGEADLDEAKRIALEKYDDLRLRVRDKKPAKELTFNDMYGLWWAEKKQELEVSYRAKGRSGETKRIRWFEMYARRYWLPHFGEFKIDLLDRKIVQGYWSWRIDYWIQASDEEREKQGNHALNPAKISLDMEQSALREIFRWGHAMKLITSMPIIANPYNRQGIAAKRRASFEPDEWKKIDEYLDRWVEGKGDNDGWVNSAHIYRRKLCRLYIHWIVNFGMRTGEDNELRHRDVVRTRTDEAEMVTLKVLVSQQTKTGSRHVITQPECAARPMKSYAN